MQAIKNQLIVMGKPQAAILDYLDTAPQIPSVEGFDEYLHQYELECDAQSRWDASQRRDPVISKPNYFI